jgi:hypothetical protein
VLVTSLPTPEIVEAVYLDDDTGVINATDGNVTIAVETWVKLHGKKDSGNIRVKGDNEVRLFVNGKERTKVNPPSEGKQELHFYVERNGSVKTVSTPEERSTQFLVFGKSNFEGSIAGSSSKNLDVTGTVIAPAGPAGDG